MQHWAKRFVFLLLCANYIQADVSISIFVHGTIVGFKSLIVKWPLAAKLMYIPDGIKTVKSQDKETVVHQLACEFCRKNPTRFMYDHFYSFGWSGQLSFAHREAAAKRLAKQLEQLVDRYEKEYGMRPVVRMVTFSHGGNVALNMSKYLKKKCQIELITIACPVQAATRYLVQADCFCKVYAISSVGDIIQCIDPINICYNLVSNYVPVISERFFEYDLTKLKQANVLVNGQSLGHFELFNMFNKHVPAVLQQLDTASICGTKKLEVDIADTKFRFFKGYNLLPVLLGQEI